MKHIENQYNQTDLEEETPHIGNQENEYEHHLFI